MRNPGVSLTISFISILSSAVLRRTMSQFVYPQPTKADGKKVLIISSHPNVGKSFNHKLIEVAKETLEAAGHAVIVDDLVAINFNPVGGPQDFASIQNPDFFDYQAEQKYASYNDGFAADVQQQIDLAKWSDVVIHQFPVYWWNLPAIHKGWLDRILAYHLAYSGDKFIFAGKSWMFSVTTGGPTSVYMPGGFVGGVTTFLDSAISATPKFLKVKALPVFLAGGSGRWSAEEKEIAIAEYINHLRAFVLEDIDPNSVPTPKLTASLAVA